MQIYKENQRPTISDPKKYYLQTRVHEGLQLRVGIQSPQQQAVQSEVTVEAVVAGVLGPLGELNDSGSHEVGDGLQDHLLQSGRLLHRWQHGSYVLNGLLESVL